MHWHTHERIRRPLAFDRYEPDQELRRESLLSLGNGVLLSRACAPEASADGPHYPGTYRAGLYDRLSEEVDGRRIENESLVNLPNWLPLSFRHDDEDLWFSLETVEILAYRQSLDTARGVLRRDARVRDREGRETTIRERRLVSMAQPHVAALLLEIEPRNWTGFIDVRSAIDGDVRNEVVTRHAPFAHRHLEVLSRQAVDPELLVLLARTRQSRIEIATVVRNRVWAGTVAPRRVVEERRAIAEHVRCRVTPSRPARIEKVAAIFTARDPAVAGAEDAAVRTAWQAPEFAELEHAHATAWTRLWRRSGIATERENVVHASEFHLFHVLQTVSPHSILTDAGFPPRGWQEGYRGQIFWDELFVFPVLNVRFPELARSLLLYRYLRLDEARIAAARHGFRGAMFPWRSASSGAESTPRLQFNLLSSRFMLDHTHLQRHVGSAIAYNVWHYVLTTGDWQFLSEFGAELILEIARFWASIAQLDPESDRYDIRGVVGPDEYHEAYPGAERAGLDNNAYTNVMAAWTLCRGLEVLDHVPARRAEELRQFLQIDQREFELWDRVSRRLRVPFHGERIISQFDGFDRLKPLDARAFRDVRRGERVDWRLAADGESADDYQVVKQPDVLMLPYLLPGERLTALLARLGYEYTSADLERTANYYLSRITHESSLSRVVCAGALTSVDAAASWRFFEEALRPDFHPPCGSRSEEGLHLGAMAGSVDILQRLYLGVSIGPEGLTVEPTPPAELGAVRLDMQIQGTGVELELAGGHLRIRSDGKSRSALSVLHHGRSERLVSGTRITIPVLPPSAPAPYPRE